MITFLCSHCGASLRSEQKVGTRGRCPRCKQMIEASSDSARPGSSSLKKTHSPEVGLEETVCATPAEPPVFHSATTHSEQDLSILTPTQAGELGQIGPYRVLSVLGSGGMGIVFQAEDTLLQRPVALKVMKAELAAFDEHRRRFLREARAAAAIDHEHIVTIYQVGDHEGVPYLAMKLLRGESLEDRLNRLGGPLPLPQVLRIGGQVAAGLQAAHARSLIHRDIKPANIWLEEGRDWVRIVDFGLARDTEEQGTLTQVGMILGTPAYMSPEQASGESVDSRCDLFSLGCVLYRMSTGRLPFRGKNSLSVLQALVNHQPPAPVALVPTLAPGFSELVMSLLEKQPDHRPASAEHVRQALERMAEQLAHPPRQASSVGKAAPRATPPPGQRRAAEAPAAEVEEAPTVSAAHSSRKRRGHRHKGRSAGGREDYWERKVILLAVLVGILVLLLIGFLVARGILRSRSQQAAQPGALQCCAGFLLLGPEGALLSAQAEGLGLKQAGGGVAL